MNAPTDFSALKTRQQAAWASGDYAVVSGGGSNTASGVGSSVTGFAHITAIHDWATCPDLNCFQP